MTLLHRIIVAILALVAIPATAAQLTLTWVDNSNNETGFTVERAPGLDAATGFTPVANLPANALVYVDSALADSTPYSYRVCAFNAAGKSGYSNTASATTRDPVPSIPGSPAATPPPAYTPPSLSLTLSVGETITIVAKN